MHKTTIQLAAFLLAGWLAACASQAEELTAQREAQACRATFQALSGKHLAAAPMPSDLRDAVVDAYLRKLDPRKLYFHQGDVERLHQRAQSLQKDLQRGDATLMHETLAIYEQRVRQHHRIAMELLKREFDFTIDETIDLNFRDQAFCVSVVESQHRWRKWLKYEVLYSRLPGETRGQRKARLQRRHQRFLQQITTANREEQLETFLTCVARVFDPHNTYLSPSTVDSYRS